MRLTLYAFLALAIITALWLSSGSTPRWVRVAAALAVGVSMLPNLSAGFWTSGIDVPAFFREALYAKYLSPGDTVVVLPYGINGESMMWQLQSRWYFRMAGGYAGNPPLEFRQWPIVRVFYRIGTVALPAAGDQLKAFLATHGAAAVLVDDRDAGIWRPLMATLDAAPIDAGGMTIYRAAPAELAPWRSANALAMETRIDRTRFAALVLAAVNYLHGGHPPAALTPAEVYKLGLMPAGWIVVPKKTEPPWDEGGINLPRHPSDPHQLDDLWLAVDEQGRIEVGVTGWYPALRAVLGEYRADAIGFVPRDLEQPARGGEEDLRGRLVMTFSADGLARAALRAHGETAAAAAARDFPRGRRNAGRDERGGQYDDDGDDGCLRMARGCRRVFHLPGTLDALFGRAVGGGLSSFYVGDGPDPPQSIWFLAWWAHALANRINPLFTHALWAPGGFGLAWTTNIPLAAWLMLPVTHALGAVAAYNILCLLCPPMVGWAAFVMCRHVVREFVPALFGGFVFGFSPYLICKLLGDIDLALVPMLPLAVYLTMRGLNGTLRRRNFVVLLVLVFCAQFLLFIETFATMTMSAAIAIASARSFGIRNENRVELPTRRTRN